MFCFFLYKSLIHFSTINNNCNNAINDNIDNLILQVLELIEMKKEEKRYMASANYGEVYR